ncbi:hypothetical protein D1872_257750 [compost metagenome]
MADDDFARDAEAGADMAVFPVAVGGLVQVHEVHIDRFPWDIAVKLGVQMKQWLLQLRQTGDPHFGRGEGMHPSDHAGAGRVAVGLLQEVVNFIRRFDDRLEDDRIRESGVLIELLGDNAGVLGDLLERLWTVQVLTAGNEPK